MQREHGGGSARVSLVALAAVVTVAAISIPDLRLHLDSPSGGVIIVTLLGMANLFTAAFASQRFARTASRLDAAVGVSLGIMATAEIGYSLNRAAVATNQVTSTAVLPYIVIAAGLLAVVALLPDRTLLRRPRAELVVLWCGVVIVPVFVAQRVGLLPGTNTAPDAAGAELIALRALAVALLAGAAAALAAFHRRDEDALARWLLVALALGALAQLDRLAEGPSRSPELTWAHVLHAAAAAALCIGCVREVRTYHRRLTEMAVVDERRRIARDLHDGVAQDVAFIASQTKRLNDQVGSERLDMIASAAERALADSRSIVGALTRSSAQPLGASLALQAREFARRWSLEVDVATHDDVAVEPEKQEAVLRIVGEALSNAARHADATRVHIEVATSAEGPLRVAVTDDGCGFDTVFAELAPPRGFGLRSMRERAQLVGGDVALMSEPGHGTRVEIAIP